MWLLQSVLGLEKRRWRKSSEREGVHPLPKNTSWLHHKSLLPYIWHLAPLHFVFVPQHLVSPIPHLCSASYISIIPSHIIVSTIPHLTFTHFYFLLLPTSPLPSQHLIFTRPHIIYTLSSTLIIYPLTPYFLSHTHLIFFCTPTPHLHYSIDTPLRAIFTEVPLRYLWLSPCRTNRWIDYHVPFHRLRGVDMGPFDSGAQTDSLNRKAHIQTHIIHMQYIYAECSCDA